MTITFAQIPATGVGLSQRLRILVRGRSRSTTRRTLLALIAGLMVVMVIVFVTSLVTFTRAHGTADTVRTRSAPAILGIVAARAALVHADNAAISSFRTGAQLVGPGEEFRNQIAIASQSLARVAEDNVAGEAGSRKLQLIEGLLVTYTGLIGQADAQFRQAGGETLGATYLWSGSRLLHKGDGILAQLDTLLAAQKTALSDQLRASSMTPRAALVLLLPVVAMFALLVVAQIVFRRRFRRRVNPWLVLAAVLLVALSWISSRVVVLQHHLEDSQSMLYQLESDSRVQTSGADVGRQRALRELVLSTECGNPGGCGNTVGVTAGGAVDDHGLTPKIREVNAQTAAASANAGLESLIYILAILIAAAVFLGFRPRLYEYRYRPR